MSAAAMGLPDVTDLYVKWQHQGWQIGTGSIASGLGHWTSDDPESYQ